MCNDRYLDLIKIIAYSKFDQNPFTCSQDTEWKLNFDIKGHTSIEN